MRKDKLTFSEDLMTGPSTSTCLASMSEVFCETTFVQLHEPC